ncbi:hypothetical protein SAMN05216267_10804 [Actinacidiphila rubida]|uniref:Uncharacterized protein n=1 Tax=Actinacidiphila rubida TaxID=310780 RepID=A0A1H8UP06_9ACTN|nr:hypothetical protein SAMN05216267_10804 [Actinacidiphila rubida]
MTARPGPAPRVRSTGAPELSNKCLRAIGRATFLGTATAVAAATWLRT